jgi:hypothetical protein
MLAHRSVLRAQDKIFQEAGVAVSQQQRMLPDADQQLMMICSLSPPETLSTAGAGHYAGTTLVQPPPCIREEAVLVST